MKRIINDDVKAEIKILADKGYSRPAIRERLIKKEIVKTISIKSIERALNRKKNKILRHTSDTLTTNNNYALV
jgi:hypothetical protein